MSFENTHSEQTVEAPSAPAAEHAGSPGLVEVSGPLVTLTWVVFLVTAFLLYKVAWKPILRALDLREKSIRKDLSDAAEARAEVARVEERGRQVVADAESRQREILAQARQAAEDAAARLRQQAEEESATLLNGAHREIELAAEKARRRLRAESADMAIALAGKLIGENMDAAKHETLVERLAREA